MSGEGDGPVPGGPREHRPKDEEEVRHFWNQVASDWRVQVGTLGDVNRRLSSDPVLWRFLGLVEGLTVLDAGSGTGYLAGLLRGRGADVVGVDLSDEMIAIARADHPEVTFRRDSVSRLSSCADGSFDAVVSNYVLMDLPDLDGALTSIHRVLRPGGVAVLVFSHPCFPQGFRSEGPDGKALGYHWPFPYFGERRCIEPPWGHFQSEFIWFHRPLSTYWKAFVAAGFQVEAFEEPRLDVDADADALGESEREVRKVQVRPYSVAFKLRRPS